jgi:hypothetical protein
MATYSFAPIAAQNRSRRKGNDGCEEEEEGCEEDSSKGCTEGGKGDYKQSGRSPQPAKNTGSPRTSDW